MAGPPVSIPLRSLEELRSRSYFHSRDFLFNKSSVPLQKRAPSRERRPRLLACHDMQGGYRDDRWIQGSDNGGAYTLTHWRLLDTFVYFSHNLVTLPPPCWTNAAHLHGVQVLGTFITEWKEGAEICQELLDSEESACMYADLLAELAWALGFDGWLINIENPVAPHQVPNLEEFVKFLTAFMLSRVPDSQVIWYDSVTTDGNLWWQNCLNRMNKPFFDVSDGIFTNYLWEKNYPKQSARAAGERACDVYMGVDVFGRNTYGGGGFHCDVALKVARDAGVSSALFAPGWCYENGHDEKKWWESIENCWPPAREDVVQLPFFTDFNTGRDVTKCIGIGRTKVSDLPWSNISCQTLQPLIHVAQLVHQSTVTTGEEATVTSGSLCIEVAGSVCDDEVSFLRLYRTGTVVEEPFLCVSYSVPVECNSNCGLALGVETKEGEKRFFFLLGSVAAGTETLPRIHQFRNTSAVFDYAKRDDERDASSKGESWKVRDFTLDWGWYKLVDIFGVYSTAKDLQPVLVNLLEQDDTVFDREAHAQPERSRTQITSRKLGPLAAQDLTRRSKVCCSLQLGGISIASSSHEHSFTLQDPGLKGENPSWVVEDGGQRFLSINLSWSLPTQSSDPCSWVSERYHLFVKMDHSDDDLGYLGMAMVGAFYVYKLPVPELAHAITFHLQRQCGCGKVQTVDSHGTSYVLEMATLE